MITHETRSLARHLLACEAIAGGASKPNETATLRVYEKLRQHLCLLAGTAAFLSIASRALAQAKSEAPSLWAVQVSADGSLQGVGEFEPQLHTDEKQAGEAGVVLIARLLSLLLIFVGETLTLGLVRDVWPDASFDVSDSVERRKA